VSWIIAYQLSTVEPSRLWWRSMGGTGFYAPGSSRIDCCKPVVYDQIIEVAQPNNQEKNEYDRMNISTLTV